MVNSTFTGNSAAFDGGAIATSGGTTIVNYSTFYNNNSAPFFGGGAISGPAYLAGNIFDSGPSNSPQCNGSPTDSGYNLSSDNSCGFSAAGSANNASLNLGGLSGGVHTPADPSDAIGAIPNGTNINNNGVPLKCNNTTTDQTGADRPINSWTGCTSGAVEVIPPPTCPQPTAISNTVELYECIAWANTVSAGADTLGLDADITLSTTLPNITTEITLNGGGYFVDGNTSMRVFRVQAAGNFSVNDVTIQNGSSGRGGGIHNVGSLTVTNSTFSDNSVTNLRGGAIYNDGTLTVTNSTFSGNSATADPGDTSFGGAIHSWNGTATVTNSTFYNNSAVIGGAIYNYELGTLKVTNSTFSDNSAIANDTPVGGGYGGGIYNDGTLTVTNSTFSGNTGVNPGGAIATGEGTTRVNYSTFHNNSASLYGCGAIIGPAYLTGNIFDRGPSNIAQCCGLLIDKGYNLSSDDSCGFDGSADGSADNATLNLGALSGSGPGQQVHTPAYPSDAIGAIPNGTSIPNGSETLACDGATTDQLGANRPINVGDACTIGAAEVAMPPPVCDISDTSIAKMDMTTAQLSWTNSGDPAAEYRIFRSSLPYSGYSPLDETVSGTSHNVTIDPLQNYYYEVRGYANANDVDDDYSCKSGRFGVFFFALAPGS